MNTLMLIDGVIGFAAIVVMFLTLLLPDKWSSGSAWRLTQDNNAGLLLSKPSQRLRRLSQWIFGLTLILMSLAILIFMPILFEIIGPVHEFGVALWMLLLAEALSAIAVILCAVFGFGLAAWSNVVEVVREVHFCDMEGSREIVIMDKHLLKGVKTYNFNVQELTDLQVTHHKSVDAISGLVPALGIALPTSVIRGELVKISFVFNESMYFNIIKRSNLNDGATRMIDIIEKWCSIKSTNIQGQKITPANFFKF